jgi:hypothetical protein
MQQRQPRLGDVLDDYCPRERRLTNHVVVAMVHDTIKQTRCTTCDADHEYKHAALPRQRKKSEDSALYSQVLANVTPKRVAPMQTPLAASESEAPSPPASAPPPPVTSVQPIAASRLDEFEALFATPDAPPPDDGHEQVEEGPLHRRLIRAQLPRHEGQVSTSRQAPDFTIRQPATGRAKRFGGQRPFRAASGPQANGRHNGNSNGNGNTRGGQRHAGRPNGSRPNNQRSGGGRNRQK